MQNETSELIKEKKGRSNTDPGHVSLDISSIGILSYNKFLLPENQLKMLLLWVQCVIFIKFMYSYNYQPLSSTFLSIASLQYLWYGQVTGEITVDAIFFLENVLDVHLFLL